jgi:DNA-binding PadR family transcriptional regulator
MLKVNETEALIISLIKQNRSGQCYGLDLVKNSDGKLKKSSIYVRLLRMEEKGLITSEKQAKGGLRYYELTGQGELAFENYIKQLHSFVHGVSYAT